MPQGTPSAKQPRQAATRLRRLRPHVPSSMYALKRADESVTIVKAPALAGPGRIGVSFEGNVKFASTTVRGDFSFVPEGQ